MVSGDAGAPAKSLPASIVERERRREDPGCRPDLCAAGVGSGSQPLFLLCLLSVGRSRDIPTTIQQGPTTILWTTLAGIGARSESNCFHFDM